MYKKISILFAILSATFMLAFTLVPAAQAAPSGIMNHDEWVNICTLWNIDHYGHVVCLDATKQADVENACNCTGEKLNTWTSNGHNFKSLRYFSPYNEYNMVVYRQWDAGLPWKADNKDWRLGSTCCHESG